MEMLMFEVIRKKTSILIGGEFFPVNLVEEWIEEIKADRVGRESEDAVTKLNNEELFSGKSSDEELDEEDDSSCWSEEDSSEKLNEFVNWEYVPETPINELGGFETDKDEEGDMIRMENSLMFQDIEESGERVENVLLDQGDTLNGRKQNIQAREVSLNNELVQGNDRCDTWAAANEEELLKVHNAVVEKEPDD